MKKFLFAGVLTLVSLVLSAAEIALPFDVTALAEQGAKKLPDYITVSGENGALKISIAAHEGKGGYDGQYMIDAKKGGGRTVNLSVEVKSANIVAVDHKGKDSIGKISFGGVTASLPAGNTDWKTISMKNVKIPGNGQLKLKVSLRDVTGEVLLRNPKAQFSASTKDLKKVQKKSKNK